MDEQVVRWVDQSIVTGRKRAPKADLGKLSDAELMDRLKDGEPEALSYLFDRYHRLVLRIASKLVRDRAEAEDVMQEVFFEVYRVAGRFDPTKGTAKSWIVQFAYHKGINRRKYLALRGVFEDQQIAAFDPDETSYSPHDNNGHSLQDTLTILRKGLASLTSRQREVVELVCFEGFSLREIAERTKESLGNVRHHYYRGIDKLREIVNGNSSANNGGRGGNSGGGK